MYLLQYSTGVFVTVQYRCISVFVTVQYRCICVFVTVQYLQYSTCVFVTVHVFVYLLQYSTGVFQQACCLVLLECNNYQNPIFSCAPFSVKGVHFIFFTYLILFRTMSLDTTAA